MKTNDDNKSRRDFLRDAFWGGSLAGMGVLIGLSTRRVQAENKVWQIDPEKCTSCGRCATACVLEESAVKCVQTHEICGYCKICFGFFTPQPHALNEGAENQICPLGAIDRRFVEDPYYEYNVNEDLCIGCAKCVKTCAAFGNASLYLQVRHDRCVNCNQCAIALVCPSGAFQRVPANHPYLFKGADHA
ncbi:4Fe-4S binding protein [Planctomycetota bacterium]